MSVMAEKLIIDLFKAPKEGGIKGGKYVARVAIGYDKDNRPRYRYFKTVQEQQDFVRRHSQELSEKNKKKDKDKKKTKKPAPKTPSKDSLTVGGKTGKKPSSEGRVYIRGKK